MFKTLLLTIFKNIGLMFLSEKMVFWALKTAAHYTDNKIDDNIIAIVQGAYKNDSEQVKNGIEQLLKEV